MLDLAEAGRPVAEIAQQLGVTGQTIYNWRKTLAPYDRHALEMVLVSIQRLMRLLGHDPSSGDDTDTSAGKGSSRRYGVKLAQLLEAGLIKADDVLVSTDGVWSARARITSDARIVMDDELYETPSGAACAA